VGEEGRWMDESPNYIQPPVGRVTVR
jgi:hypothetical protein